MIQTRNSVIARLVGRLPKAEPAAVQIQDYPTIRLASAADLIAAARLLKEELGFDYLEMVTAVDWGGPVLLEGFITGSTTNPLSGKPPLPPVTPAPGAGIKYRPVFDLLWCLGNITDRLKVFLRLEVPRDSPEVPSLTGLFAAADWQERETFDLLGIHFTGHPNLTKILTPDFIAGHPLRKDYVHQKDRFDAD